jgi:acetyl-CoA carboxylase carboxyltransferase component
VLSIVRRTAAERAGQSFDEEADTKIKQAVEDQINRESYAFFATARVWDDGIIDPRDTRSALGIALSAVHSNVVEGTMRWGVFRM